MGEPQYKLRMILEDPYGKTWQVAMPIDAFDARDRYVHLTPPSDDPLGAMLSGHTFESVIEVIRKKEYRKDDFEAMARQLARVLGERMEDEEGWHGISRQEHYEQERKRP